MRGKRENTKKSKFITIDNWRVLLLNREKRKELGGGISIWRVGCRRDRRK